MDFSYWSANVAVLAVYAVVAVTHLLGMRDAATGARRRGRSLAPGLLAQAVIFQIGLLMVLLALVSPMGYWSHQLIWIRNLQDVVLAVMAPALIVLGAPWLPLARGAGLGRRGQHDGEESMAAGDGDGEAGGRSAPP